MFIKFRLIKICIFLTGISACTHTIENVPEFESGNIVGYVECLDEYGQKIDPSDVKITVNNAKDYINRTNQDGYFNMSVPIGYQHIIFEKDGLGTYHLKNQLILGGEVPIVINSALLCKPVDVNVVLDSVSVTKDGNYIHISGNAESQTPFDLVLIYYTESSGNLNYQWIKTCDEPEESKFLCQFQEMLYTLNLPEQTQFIYIAIGCQNAFDYIKSEGGTLKKQTEYIKINLSE
ncbi:hypothetical protein ACE1ET_11375 [Saccharicrinis sp. FJH62]